MRKLYLLTSFILFLFYKANSQDTANFIFTVNANQLVSFTNTSHLHGDGSRKAFWSFGDGTKQTTSPLANTYHQYSLAGSYEVCLKIYKYSNSAHDSVLTSDVCKTVNLSGNTSPDTCKAYFTSSSATNNTLTQVFVAQPWHNHEKKPEDICWNFGDNHDTCIHYNPSLSNNYAVYHKYSKAGQYNVCVKIRYQGGCISDYCHAIAVEGTSSISCSVNVSEVTTNINSLERHFYAGVISDRKAEKICWAFGDGRDTCINLPNPLTAQSLLITHHYAAPGVYQVCARVKYADGCEAQKCLEVVIRSVNDICGGYMTDSLTKERTYVFKGYSIQNSNDHVVSWRWTFGDGVSASSQQVAHSYTSAGNYEVCLYIKTDMGCETRICRHIVIEGENHPRLVLTPNPVSTTLHATFLSTLQEQVTINIFNANGTLLRTYTRFAAMGTNTWDFSLGDLPAGIYSVVVSSPHQLANAVFFKQ